ncbi:MAG: hypothetical protein GY906_39465 [bacterium]|nr:hypothetical protein [bacterium]
MSSGRISVIVVLTVALTLATTAQGLVWYDRGRLTIDDVELFQDADDPSRYYYLPPAPALTLNEDGTPQLLCIKFVDPDGKSSGGLLHFLATLRLSEERLSEIADKLNEQVPGAEVAGALPLLEGSAGEDGQLATFQVISAVLSDTADGGMTRTVLSSGHAPVTPGSRAAVAAILDAHGATLLFDSLRGATSDISVSMSAQYEARVRGYNAVVRAEVETIYEHFSVVMNRQEGFTKRELRDIVDELQQEELLEIEVFDRAEGLGIDTKAMQSLLDLVTDKLVNLMFDHETGWAKVPDSETAVEKGQIRGRQERGAFVKWFAGTGNQPYMTDNQFVLKSRKDIRRKSFVLNLAQDTTIRMPVYLTGNMSGVWEEHQENTEVFRIVNLSDPAFQIRELRFVLDGEWAGAFDGLVNWVSVQIHKDYKGEERPAVDAQTQLSSADVTAGQLERVLRYPRLAESGAEWLGYQYRVGWSLLRKGNVTEPPNDEWLTTTDPIVTLRPPLEITKAELELDRQTMIDRGYRVGVVEIRSEVLGKQDTRRHSVIRVGDADPVTILRAVHDPGAEPEVRITWVEASGGGRVRGEWIGLNAGYLWVEAPEVVESEE